MEFLPKKATITRKCCSVPQCSSMAERDRTLSFHTFPKENELTRVSDMFGNYTTSGRRKEWARLLKIGKPVSKCMYVCSKHFTADNFRFPDIPAQKRYLKFDAIPSENLPQSPKTGLDVQTRWHLDRRKKGLPASVPLRPLIDEENEPESSGSATNPRQVEVKVEPPDDQKPPPIVFVKTEVTDYDYGDTRQPSTGIDLITTSSCSAAINLGRDASTESEANRPDFRFVDVGENVPAPSGRNADVDPLELSVPEPPIKQEQLDETQESPPVPIAHRTPPLDGPYEQVGTVRGAVSSSSGSILTGGPVIVTTYDQEQCAQATRKSAHETNGKETLAFEKANDAGEKPYACEVCSASFDRPSDLTDHRGLHGHGKTYSGGGCKATFRQGSRLAARKWLAGKTYSCEVCKATFSQGSSLALHYRLHGKTYF